LDHGREMLIGLFQRTLRPLVTDRGRAQGQPGDGEDADVDHQRGIGARYRLHDEGTAALHRIADGERRHGHGEERGPPRAEPQRSPDHEGKQEVGVLGLREERRRQQAPEDRHSREHGTAHHERQLERRTPTDAHVSRTGPREPSEKYGRHHQCAEVVTGPPEAQSRPDPASRYHIDQPQGRDTDGGTRQRPHWYRDADERADTAEIVEGQVLSGLAAEEIGGEHRLGGVAARNPGRGEERNARRRIREKRAEQDSRPIAGAQQHQRGHGEAGGRPHGGDGRPDRRVAQADLGDHEVRGGQRQRARQPAQRRQRCPGGTRHGARERFVAARLGASAYRRGSFRSPTPVLRRHSAGSSLPGSTPDPSTQRRR